MSGWRTGRSRTALLAALSGAAAFVGTPLSAAEIRAVATIKPIHALVAQVMDGIGTPALLVTGGASPHSFALKPSDAHALSQANVFFRVSESIEPFTRRAVDVLPADARKVTLADAPGMVLLERSESAASGDHDHDHGDESHSRDLHVWLDPENAKTMLTAIAAALSEIAPEHRAKLEANAEAGRARLDALEAGISAELSSARGKPFAVFHDAFQYFTHRFGLLPGVAISVVPETAPSAKHLSDVRAMLKSAGAACVFSEPNANPAVIAAVTEGTGAKSGTLDPEGLLLEPGPGAYDVLLRGLARGFRSCLAD